MPPASLPFSLTPLRAPPTCPALARLTSCLLPFPRDKRSGSDTAPHPGGSCTISSWDSCPFPGAEEPPRWSPIRCLYPPGGRRGPSGGLFLHHVAYWTTALPDPGAGQGSHSRPSPGVAPGSTDGDVDSWAPG